TRFNWSFADVASVIRQMQLYTRSSIYLADLYNVNNMTKIITKCDTRLDEYLSYDSAPAGKGVVPTGTQSILRRNNSLATAAIRPYAAAGPATSTSTVN